MDVQKESTQDIVNALSPGHKPKTDNFKELIKKNPSSTNVISVDITKKDSLEKVGSEIEQYGNVFLYSVNKNGTSTMPWGMLYKTEWKQKDSNSTETTEGGNSDLLKLLGTIDDSVTKKKWESGLGFENFVRCEPDDSVKEKLGVVRKKFSKDIIGKTKVIVFDSENTKLKAIFSPDQMENFLEEDE